MALYAIVNNLDGGYSHDQKMIKEAGFQIGDEFVVHNVSMGQSHTTVYLEKDGRGYNSIFFRYEENGEPVDIYRDSRYNPYL